MPVGAPGVEVISTSKDGGYENKSGTSMAAPHVTGVAALMAAVAPSLPAADLRALLLQHAVRTSAPVGAGMVDALGSRARGQHGGEPRARPAAAGPRPERDPPRPRAPRGDAGPDRAASARARAWPGSSCKLDGRPRRRPCAAAAAIAHVRLRGPAGRRLTVDAIAADGRTLATAAAACAPCAPASSGVGTGGGIGGTVPAG